MQIELFSQRLGLGEETVLAVRKRKSREIFLKYTGV